MIVLDTHAWVWWLTKPEKVGRKARRALKSAKRIGIPAISLWEIASKAEAGKLRFDRPYDVWIEDALSSDDRIELLPLDPTVAVASVRLAWNHRDPADRFIVASAMKWEAPLITADEAIESSRLVKCLWD